MSLAQTFVLEPPRLRRVEVAGVAFLWSFIFLAALNAIGVTQPWPWAAAAVLAMLGGERVWQRWRAQEVTVGVDGVLMAARSGTRFILHEAIETITFEAAEKLKELSHVRLDLTSGESVRIAVPCEVTETVGAELLSALRERHRLASEPRELPDGVDRDDQEAADWLQALKSLGRGGYRTRAVDPDALTRALDDPLPAATRAATAIALAELQPKKARARLRVAADDYAQPATKRRLLRIAAGDEEELAETFAELAEEEVRP